MSFTDQKPRVATEEDCKRQWAGGKNGKKFRCYLCGHKFVPGDTWRFQGTAGGGYTDENGKKWGVTNFLVCEKCDGPDVVQKWLHHNIEFFATEKYWALRDE